ncbi:MAG: hypothetical protein ACP5QS_07275 [bacterium]
MSQEIGMKILNLEWTERVGRTEYCDHTALVRYITGYDPLSANPEESYRAWRTFYEWAEYDIL